MEVTGMKALIISADNFEDSELLFPFYRLLEENIAVDIASLKTGDIKGKHGYRATANLAVREVDPSAYDLLVLPGGRAPSALRDDADVQSIVRGFMDSGRPVAAICHGPQILVSAGVMKGRKATCYRTVAGELKAAGAGYLDREVVVDGNLITSRQPGDLPAFMREIMKAVSL